MIENDADDRSLTKEIFNEEWPKATIHFISGIELAACLENIHYHPNLILLSMNAQPLNGLEMIRLIRATPGYASIPVAVLSETSLTDEIREIYQAGANSFIKKPAGYSDAISKIKSFINYWSQTAELPEALPPLEWSLQ